MRVYDEKIFELRYVIALIVLISGCTTLTPFQ